MVIVPSELPAAPDLRPGQVWLRLEWRFPVTISQVAFSQFVDSPCHDLQPVTGYTLQAESYSASQGLKQWQDLDDKRGHTPPLDQPVTITLKQPICTQALRLLLQGEAGTKVGLSEVKVLGDPPSLPMAYAPTWQAHWIWFELTLLMPHREPIRCYLRRSFTMADPTQLQAIWLCGTALDRSTMWLNGHKALQDISHAGGVVRQAQVQPIPLGWLRPGENRLAVLTGDLYEVGSQGLLAELVLLGKDGSRTVIRQMSNGKDTQNLAPSLPGSCQIIRIPVIGQCR